MLYLCLPVFAGVCRVGPSYVKEGSKVQSSKALNTTPDLWLNIQKNYDLWHTANETQAWKKVKPVARGIETLPPDIGPS